MTSPLAKLLENPYIQSVHPAHAEVYHEHMYTNARLINRGHTV